MTPPSYYSSNLLLIALETLRLLVQIEVYFLQQNFQYSGKVRGALILNQRVSVTRKMF